MVQSNEEKETNQNLKSESKDKLKEKTKKNKSQSNSSESRQKNNKRKKQPIRTVLWTYPLVVLLILDVALLYAFISGVGSNDMIPSQLKFKSILAKKTEHYTSTKHITPIYHDFDDFIYTNAKICKYFIRNKENNKTSAFVLTLMLLICSLLETPSTNGVGGYVNIFLVDGRNSSNLKFESLSTDIQYKSLKHKNLFPAQVPNYLFMIKIMYESLNKEERDFLAKTFFDPKFELNFSKLFKLPNDLHNMLTEYQYYPQVKSVNYMRHFYDEMKNVKNSSTYAYNLARIMAIKAPSEPFYNPQNIEFTSEITKMYRDMGFEIVKAKSIKFESSTKDSMKISKDLTAFLPGFINSFCSNTDSKNQMCHENMRRNLIHNFEFSKEHLFKSLKKQLKNKRKISDELSPPQVSHSLISRNNQTYIISSTMGSSLTKLSNTKDGILINDILRHFKEETEYIGPPNIIYSPSNLHIFFEKMGSLENNLLQMQIMQSTIKELNRTEAEDNVFQKPVILDLINKHMEIITTDNFLSSGLVVRTHKNKREFLEYETKNQQLKNLNANNIIEL